MGASHRDRGPRDAPLWRRGEVRAVAVLAAASATSVALIVARGLVAERPTYHFLLWNLFLAWIPLVMALATAAAARRARPRWWLVAVLAAAWFFFLPNAPYIVTDLIHLRTNRGAPLWVDLLTVAMAAWTAMLVGIASMRVVHGVVLARGVRRLPAALGVGAVWFAAALGVFIGRFLRWNSWDVVMNPRSVSSDTWQAARDGDAFLFTVGFGALLWLAYAAVTAIGGDALAGRPLNDDSAD